MINSLQPISSDNFNSVSQNIFIENHAPFIMLQTNLTNRPIKMLIDTGASISLLASHIITNKITLGEPKFRLFGFGNTINGILTNGMTEAIAEVDNSKINIALHVIDVNWTGPAEGFIGFDFLTKYNAHIDMENMKIYLRLRKTLGVEKNDSNTNTLKGGNNKADSGNSVSQIRKNKGGKSKNRNKKKKKITETSTILNIPEDGGEFNKKLDDLYKHINGIHSEFKEYIESTVFSLNQRGNEAKFRVNCEQNIEKNILEHIQKTINICHTETFDVTENGNTSHHIGGKQQSFTIRHLGYDPGTTPGEERENAHGIFHSHPTELTMSNRTDTIYKQLVLDHCSNEESKFTKSICEEFPYQFYIEDDNLNCTHVLKHHIKIIPGSKIINVRQYRIPHSHRKILLDMINEYEKQGLIEKCQSSYNSPAILVGKNDDNHEKTDFRFVVDYRKLNEICEIQNFPIPLIDDILDSLNGCTYFTTLDIKGAFHQIILDEDSRDFTAFTVGHFQYRWKRMPMGLSSAPLTWQRAINTILQGLIGNGVYVYLDDIIIHAKTFQTHNELLFHVMSLLRDHGLQLKISKSNFFAKHFEYLGFIITENGLGANPRKIRAIKNFPRPQNMKQIQSFLGMINYYRRFIKNFAKLAKPLTILCKSEQPFIWTESTQNAFDTLKNILCRDILLSFPNFEEIFYVTTDASDIALGAVLSQGELPYDRPIHFFSRTLNDAQRRYSTIQKELLAIVEAIKNFRPYLYGRFFILITDHKPLCYLFNMKDCGSRLFRQRLELLDYNFKILHRPGAQNTVADALSRIEPLSIEEMLAMERKTTEINALTRAQARNELDKSNNIGFTFDERDGTILNKNNFDLIFHLIPTENNALRDKLINKFGITQFSNDWTKFKNCHFAILISNQFSRTDNLKQLISCISKIYDISQNSTSIAINVDFDNIRHYICLKNQFREKFKNTNISITIFLNKIIELIEGEDIEKTLDLYHKSVLGGHFGTDKMFKTISKFYKWNNMFSDIRNYVTKCEICRKTKYTTNNKIPMQISSLGEILFDHTYMDFVGPISPQGTDGHKYIFTATCDLTKYMIAIPTRDCSALTTAECLLEHILLKYNFPSRLISDNASNFNSKVIHELTKILNIRKIFSTPYHPQSNIIERNHRTLNAYLRAFTTKNQDSWHEILKFAMFAYNNSIHSSTGYTPHELAHGFKIKIPNHLTRSKITYDYDNLADFIRNNIASSLELAREHLFNRKIANKLQYDKNTKSLDIKVGDLIYLKTQNKNEKFQDIYDGPFEVLESYDSYVEIKRNKRRMKVHKNLIKKYTDTIFPYIELNNTNIISIWNEFRM